MKFFWFIWLIHLLQISSSFHILYISKWNVWKKLVNYLESFDHKMNYVNIPRTLQAAITITKVIRSSRRRRAVLLSA